MSFNFQDKTYPLSMIILFDHNVCARKKETIQNRVDKTHKAFSELKTKLNRYKLKTREKIEKACTAIFKANNTQPSFSYQIINKPVIIYKNKKHGRPAQNTKPEQVTVSRDQFRIVLEFNQYAFDQTLFRYGFVSELNQPQLYILSIFEVPFECYDYRVLTDSN